MIYKIELAKTVRDISVAVSLSAGLLLPSPSSAEELPLDDVKNTKSLVPVSDPKAKSLEESPTPLTWEQKMWSFPPEHIAVSIDYQYKLDRSKIVKAPAPAQGIPNYGPPSSIRYYF